MRACCSARGAERPRARWRGAALASLLCTSTGDFAATASDRQNLALTNTSLQSSGIVSAETLGRAIANEGLYLQTFINGVDSGLISPYRSLDGRLYAEAAELRQLGFRIDDSWIGDGRWVELSRIPGLVYRLDTLRQILDITVGAEQLESHRYDASAEVLRPRVSPGAVLNYDVYAQQSQSGTNAGEVNTQLLSGLLDLRAFGPVGTLTQTGLFRSQDPQPLDFEPALRLDTTVFRSDLDRLDTWRAGDLISGASLPWVTPVRLGGLQWQRNFRLQPNLVTFPVPTIRGSAAVPSTVDVLVNNVQQYSRPVQPGPFTIDNLPMITGQGEIRVVVRDAMGREQLTTMPFYASGRLLRPGLMDYSVEAGYLRRNYAVVSNDYDGHPAGSGSVRLGVSDWATLEGHTEGMQGLVAGGVGGVAGAGQLGVVSASLAGSSSGGGASGTQWSAGYQWQSGSLGAQASTQRSSSQYFTLANASLRTPPAQVVEQLSLSAGLGSSAFSVGYVGVKGAGLIATPTPSPGGATEWTRIGTVSYSQSLGGRWSVYASVFRSYSSINDTGSSLGLSCYFSNRLSVSGSAQYRQQGDFTVGLQASQPVPAEGTGSGWRLQADGGPTSSATAMAGHRFSLATVEAGVSGSDTSSSEFAAVRGALVDMDYRRLPMLTNPIRESFALVDTGVPDVTVLYENRPVGRSGADSLILIPNLAAQSRNQIAIEPRDVPPDVEIDAVKDVAVPLDRSGVFVKFPVSRVNAATVTLRLPNGTPVPVGATVTVKGAAESYIVGYDGQAYVKHLVAHNVLLADWSKGRCQAEVSYEPTPGTAQALGPLNCTAARP